MSSVRQAHGLSPSKAVEPGKPRPCPGWATAIPFWVAALVIIFWPAISAAQDAAGPSAPAAFLSRDMCVRCHLLAESPGAPNPVLAWRRSVHFRSDSTCADCHGGDKFFYADLQAGHIGRPDSEGSIKMCAKCHVRETAPFLKPRSKDEKFKCAVACFDCHGYHETRAADGGLIGEAACGRCHSLEVVKPPQKALAKARARMAVLEKRVRRIKDRGFPVEGLELELAAAHRDFAAIFHEQRPEQYAAAAPAFINSLDHLKRRVKSASPFKWYLEGTAVIGFLAAIVLLLIGYQAVAGSMDSGKEDLEMMEDKENSAGRGHGQGPGSAWTARLALIVALIALALALKESLSTTHEAVRSLSQTVTKTLAPEVKKANQRAAVNSVYELKRMIVTLDQLREESADPEVQVRIDKLKAELQELSVKLLVAP